jgi:hypothetical protein
MTLAFVDARPDVAWERATRTVRGSIAGVDITADSRWWGRQWNLTAESTSPLPEKLLLFVSERGMDHGFWRDLRVGDVAFDRRFFTFCDTPALLPLVLGPATRRALADGDSIVLHARDWRVKTTSVAAAKDAVVLDRHLAIHRALADDHRAVLADWKRRIDDAGGRSDDGWPPTATLLRPSGALVVNLAWTRPTTRDAADWEDAAQSLRTEVTAHDDRERKQWTLREVRATAPTHVLGGRSFVLAGTLPFALPTLDAIVERSDIASIAVRENRITVGLRGLATARQLDGAVRIVQLVVDALAESSSPYR